MHPLTLATLITGTFWAICLTVLLVARDKTDRAMALILGCAMALCFAVLATAG